MSGTSIRSPSPKSYSLNKRVLQLVVFGSSLGSQSCCVFLHSQVLCSERLIGPQCIAKSQVIAPRVAIKLDDMNQMRSFASIATSPEDKMTFNSGVLGVIVSKRLQRKLTFDPIVQRLDTYQNIEDGFCS